MQSDIEIIQRYRNRLIQQLEDIKKAVENTVYLKQILDNEWQSNIRSEIMKHNSPTSSFTSNISYLFFQFKEKLDRIANVEKRFSSIASNKNLAIKLEAKLKDIKCNRFNYDCKNYLFEIMIAGKFAESGYLNDLDVPIGVNGSTIDAAIQLDSRELLLEATFTSQELYEVPTNDVIAFPLESMIQQVINKTKKKTSSGKQIGLANGQPAIFVLGLHHNGADDFAAQIALEEMYLKPEFSCLSASLICNHWDFSKPMLYINETSTAPLTALEAERLISVL